MATLAPRIDTIEAQVNSSGLKGSVTGSAVAAGYVGENITSSFSNTTLNSTPTNQANVVLSPGVWLLFAQLWSVAANGRYMTISVSSVSNTEGTNGVNKSYGFANTGDGGGYCAVVGYVQNISSQTTYYAVGTAGASTTGCYGNISAVRIA